MKYILLFTIILGLGACKSSKQIVDATPNENGNLVGLADKNSFLQEPYVQWFGENYESYQLDAEIVKKIKPILKNIKIKAVMGTWCGDSRRETPHFYKLLDAVDFDIKDLQMITVDRSKKSKNDEQVDLNIMRVPTFIFYKKGKEINRFVEYPRETLEKDILQILQEIGYKHSYIE